MTKTNRIKQPEPVQTSKMTFRGERWKETVDGFLYVHRVPSAVQNIIVWQTEAFHFTNPV